MGTWAAGPFGNDAALDFVGSALDHLMSAVNEFLDDRQIDETLDAAFAAIVLINSVMEQTPSRPWGEDGQVKGEPIREAMLTCFDEQIDGMKPDPEYKREHRAALVSALDRFVALLKE
ncbi:MAG: DUF4259 domain-containing protein [Kofleriaceae bacterium]